MTKILSGYNGKSGQADGPGQVSREREIANNTVHMRNFRGKGRLARLRTVFAILVACCVFCMVVLTVLIVRNEWGTHHDKNGNVRVEKVYRQYTKADLGYIDDNGRRVVDTVWLDVPGIRDGDYLELYTGADNDSMFLNYRPSTIIATSIVMVVFIILLVLTMLEIRRMKKEDTLHIVLEDKTADEKI